MEKNKKSFHIETGALLEMKIWTRVCVEILYTNRFWNVLNVEYIWLKLLKNIC